MKRREKTKPLECWAPVYVKTGMFHLAEKCTDTPRPEDTTSYWDSQPVTYIRVRITPIKASAKRPAKKAGRTRGRLGGGTKT